MQEQGTAAAAAAAAAALHDLGEEGGAESAGRKAKGMGCRVPALHWRDGFCEFFSGGRGRGCGIIMG
jgi:hypothetical protein